MIFHTCYTDGFYTSLHIERWARYTDIYREEICLVCHLESGYQLGAIVCCNEECTCREWIESPSVSHFLDTRHTTQLAYHIKARESNRFVNKKKHIISRVLDNSLGEDAREIVEHVSTRICHSSGVIHH